MGILKCTPAHQAFRERLHVIIDQEINPHVNQRENAHLTPTVSPRTFGDWRETRLP